MQRQSWLSMFISLLGCIHESTSMSLNRQLEAKEDQTYRRDNEMLGMSLRHGTDTRTLHDTALPKLTIKRRALPSGVNPHSWSVLQTQSRPHISSKQRRQRSLPTPVIPDKRTNTFGVVSASQPTQSDSLAIYDSLDSSYFSTLDFGSNDDALYMLIDTGAANTWVMGSDCTSSSCSGHNTYGDASSSTLQITKIPFNITYGSGNVGGVVVSDEVEFMGLNVSLSFGSVSEASNAFEDFPADGILGLGRAKSNIMGVSTFMEAIGDAKLLPANLFGVHLQRTSDGATNGEINFGAPDETKYTGSLSYTTTVSDDYLWEIPADDAIVGGIPLNFSGKTAIIDTGTSFILLPADDAKKLHAQIPQSQPGANDVFNIPCSSTISIQIKISGVVYNISSQDYVGQPASSGTMCYSNILARQAFGSDQWLLGDTFLKNVYSVFDFDNSRMGFGTNASLTSTQALPPSATSTLVASSVPTGSSSGPSTQSTSSTSVSASSQLLLLPPATSTTAAILSTSSSGSSIATPTPATTSQLHNASSASSSQQNIMFMFLAWLVVSLLM